MRPSGPRGLCGLKPGGKRMPVVYVIRCYCRKEMALAIKVKCVKPAPEFGAGSDQS